MNFLKMLQIKYTRLTLACFISLKVDLYLFSKIVIQAYTEGMQIAILIIL